MFYRADSIYIIDLNQLLIFIYCWKRLLLRWSANAPASAFGFNKARLRSAGLESSGAYGKTLKM